MGRTFATGCLLCRSLFIVLDCKIILRTVLKVVKRSDVLVGKQIPAGRLDVSRKNRLDLNGVK